MVVGTRRHTVVEQHDSGHVLDSLRQHRIKMANIVMWAE